MQHPFEGILPAESVSASMTVGEPSRRSFLRSTMAGTVGLVAALLGRSEKTQAQSSVTTQAVDEEGSGQSRRFYPEYGRFRRRGWGYRQPWWMDRGNGVTTYALGEEGIYYPPPHWHGPPTTLALGEEGGTYTTMALGEEGGTWH